MTILYAFIMSIITFIMFGLDKHYAKTHHWRISELALMLLCICGGSVGGLAGMTAFRHKTNHKKFYIGIPIILAVQWILYMLRYVKYTMVFYNLIHMILSYFIN